MVAVVVVAAALPLSKDTYLRLLLSVCLSVWYAGKKGMISHIHQCKINTPMYTPSECLGTCVCSQHDVSVKTGQARTYASVAFVGSSAASSSAPFRSTGFLTQKEMNAK